MKYDVEELMRQAFEEMPIEPPIDGHEERFKSRLQSKKQTRIVSLAWVKYAAAAVVVGLGVFFFTQNKPLYPPVVANTNAQQDSSIVHPAVEKAEEFYASRAHLDWSKVDQNDQQVKDFLQSMHTLEQESKRLDSLLMLNINNEKLIEGLIDNYQYRLRVIEQLKKYIELKNRLNLPHHENNV
ncbi:MAG: hypothetical protein ACOYLH_00775 [Flavobacteriales bacterium]